MSVDIRIGGKIISGVSTVQFESGDTQESVISFYEMGSIPVEEAEVTPTTNVQEVLPSENKLLSKVIVEGVTASIDPNIQPENIKEGITILGVDGSLVNKFSSLVDRSITTVTADDLAGITSIGDAAFRSCTELASVIIPDSVTNIGQFAFRNCTGLTSVTVGNGVTSITNYAFQGCTRLTSITLPDSVTSIGDEAFYGCIGLTSVTILPITPPLLGTNAFNNTNNCPIYVPAESVDAYKSATNWSSLASRIRAIPS